jgi:D-apionolactonase
MTRRPASRRPAAGRLPFGRTFLRHGRDGPSAPVRTFTAGPLDFDLDGVDLARVRRAGTEVVNRIYMSVRDRNWDTVVPTISDLKVTTQRDAVAITFAARNRAGDIDLEWHGAISATDDGRITCDIDGQALADFEYCRIGFCVLHSEAAAAGRPYRAETPDGIVEGVLPRLIAPQEFVDGHELALIPSCSSLEVQLGDATVRTVFEGSLFSSEDQRNWTDASFKTCCVAGPDYPYPAVRGQAFSQRVTLIASGPPAVRSRRSGRVRRLEVGGVAATAWPSIGLGLPVGDGAEPAPREAARLRGLGLDHVRADLHLVSLDWPETLASATRAAAAIGTRLEIALFLDEAAAGQMERLATALAGVPVARAIVLPEWTPSVRTTRPGLVAEVRARLGPALGEMALIGGTDGDFAELNRDRPSRAGWDGLSYSINPQVHAFDDVSLMETVPTQATTVETARSFAESTPVLVGPVTLRQRFNPSAIGEPTLGDGDLPPSVDPRQASLFGAGWTLASLASLTRAGVASLTYYETVGRRGLMAGPETAGSTVFPVRPGMVYPMFHVFADLADRAATEPGLVETADPGSVAGLAMRRGPRLRVLVANLTGARSSVAIGPLGGRDVLVRVLDDGTATQALLAPAAFRRRTERILVHDGEVRLDLRPYAYLWLEGAAPPEPEP